MRARSYSVVQVLVGTSRVGLVGLRACQRRADESGLENREALLDFMMEDLARSNFIPEGRLDDYRAAVWREYLRRRGEDFSEFYSEVPVTIRGGADQERARLAEMIAAVLAEHELRPAITRVPASGEDLVRLEIDGAEVVCGLPTLTTLKQAVRQRLSDW